MTEKENRSETLAAYVMGDLDAAECAEIERSLEGDPDLRAELEEFREALGHVEDWMREPVSVPQVPLFLPASNPKLTGPPAEASHRTILKSLVQLAAALALFLGGYWFGHEASPPGVYSPPTTRVPEEPMVPAAPSVAETPEPGQAPANDPKSRFALESPRVRSFEQDGSLIVETKLSRSDSTAVWIVNGDFGLEK